MWLSLENNDVHEDKINMSDSSHSYIIFLSLIQTHPFLSANQMGFTENVNYYKYYKIDCGEIHGSAEKRQTQIRTM